VLDGDHASARSLKLESEIAGRDAARYRRDIERKRSEAEREDRTRLLRLDDLDRRTPAATVALKARVVVE
jgi:hypothetical protein